MNKISTVLFAVVSSAMFSACIGKCGASPYRYDKAAEEREMLKDFGRIGMGGESGIPQATGVVCPDHVEVKDGKASFVCKVTYNNGNVQNFQKDVDNGAWSVKNAE